jgi:hypothetical protein
MKRLLAVVRRIDDGFRGYVPRLPGCEVRAATAEQAEAAVIAAARAHLAAGKEGTNGMAPDQVEIIAAVEAPPPPRPRDDGMDEIYDRMRREFNPEELEVFPDWESQEWVEMTDDFLRELEGGAPEQPVDETKE